MRKPKRYSKPFEIHAEILRLKRSAKEKIERAEEIEREVKKWMDMANDPKNTPGQRKHCVESGDFQRKKAIKMRRSAEIIDDIRIPRMVRTLQELNTIPMEFIKNDPSVIKSYK